MSRFAKRGNCPSSEILEAYRDNALATARAVEAHISDCDFCAAEFQLLNVAARRRHSDTESESECVMSQATGDSATGAPPMPLALRLFAESQFAQNAMNASFGRLRAA